MKICEYGCGREAKYQFKNGKWCCSEKWQSCPANRERLKQQTIGKNNPMYKRKQTSEAKEKIRLKALGRIPHNKNCPRSEKVKEILRKKLKGREPWNKGIEAYSCRRSIEIINEKYLFFSKIEEMRYNPYKPLEEREIQVHCKNHECKNSKEKDGWFTPTSRQLEARISALENYGHDLSYFYCSQHCKDTCFLYGLQNDPYEIKDNKLPYTSTELDTLNQLVLKRDNELCHYCGEHATIVHHLRPKKLEPFFALDPDYAISVCERCHYKYGHPAGSECSTGNLAKITCSVESQKFLNQSLENI